MSQRTPTPWIAVDYDGSPTVRAHLGENEFIDVCDLTGEGSTELAEMQANAAFIVTAVNQHEALKASNAELLQLAKDYLSLLKSDYMGSNGWIGEEGPKVESIIAKYETNRSHTHSTDESCYDPNCAACHGL